jgi:malate:Na+ symporter
MTVALRSAMLEASQQGIFVGSNQIDATEPRNSQPGQSDHELRPRLMDLRIGVIPLPVYLICVAVLTYFLVRGKLPSEINVAIAVLAVGGFTCAELGKRLPLIGRIGGAAIFATFIPSALVYYKLLPAPLVSSVTDFTKSTNFLYLFITAIIVGSILGMDRRVLIGGFARIFVPLVGGSLAAALIGTLVGTLLGLGAKHTLFFLIIPIMAGGVGEGAIPLSVGYSEILHQKQGDLFAEILPVVMLGSLTAILISGGLNMLGKRYPHLTGEGRLQPGEADELHEAKQDLPADLHLSDILAAGLFAISLYLLGLLCNQLIGLPAPVAMLFITVIVKLARLASPQLQAGSFFVFRFFQVGVTYLLLFAIGIAMTPWETLMSAFAPSKLITIVATVTTLVASGFFIGKWVKLFPIDAAVVNACHSGQGGTGDVAILTAANRMQLMPFAQIATRIGGAITVTLALIVLAR